MDFHKIQSSDFQSVVDLLDASFPISRAFIERDLKEIQKHQKQMVIFTDCGQTENLSALLSMARFMIIQVASLMRCLGGARAYQIPCYTFRTSAQRACDMDNQKSHSRPTAIG